MPPVVLEPTILAGERPQTYSLDREATGNRQDLILIFKIPMEVRKDAWKFIDSLTL